VDRFGGDILRLLCKGGWRNHIFSHSVQGSCWDVGERVCLLSKALGLEEFGLHGTLLCLNDGCDTMLARS
jgi:hypothetical protein